jgi:hypothetical protein
MIYENVDNAGIIVGTSYIPDVKQKQILFNINTIEYHLIIRAHVSC